MVRTKDVHLPSAAIATAASAVSLLLTAYAMFLPDRASDVVAGLLPPLTEDFIGRTYVASQVQLFLFAMAVVVLLTAVGLAGAYYLAADREARALAVGRRLGRRARYILLAIPAVLCVLLSIHVPPTIFTPTNPEELLRQFQPAAWAARSLIGGLGLALVVLAVSATLAWLIWLGAVVLRHQLARASYQRLLDK